MSFGRTLMVLFLQPTAMSILIIVRHGQSVYNLENRFTGSLDVALTALGEQEATTAGVKLMDYQFDFAFTSTLIRAKQSLQLILNVIGQSAVPIFENAALNERMYGTLQGLNKQEIVKQFGLKQVALWRRSYAMAPPNGESLKATYERVVPYYQSVIEPKLKLGATVLIVAHGNSLRALMMYLEQISPKDIVKITIPTGLPRKYVFDENLKILTVAYL